MKVTEFGKEHTQTIMLLPGTSCTWEMNFSKLLAPLQEQYHVLSIIQGMMTVARFSPA